MAGKYGKPKDMNAPETRKAGSGSAVLGTAGSAPAGRNSATPRSDCYQKQGWGAKIGNERARRLTQEIRGMIAVRDLHDPGIWVCARQMALAAELSALDIVQLAIEVRRIRDRLAALSRRCTQRLFAGGYAGHERAAADRLAAILERYKVEIDAIKIAMNAAGK